MEIKVRKIMCRVDEILHEGGPVAEVPQKKGVIMAVIANPYAGHYEADITPMMKALEPLGAELADRLVAALGGDPARIEGYGKGAIVGVEGELEHGALWHVPGGYAMRGALGEALAIVPSTKKVAPAGTEIDLPITHVNASYVRSHFDTVTAGISDAPKPDEIVVALAMTTGPRVHARVGGLKAAEISKKDGLR
ncbi:amino acid synthesis family protein [Pseudooceanicola sp. CBS1P-1]|uniref:Amino acid synthesis family protein n=1 Tax=Pseudooceanicola albus TaxID=2692189 RepID=A0A6L7G8U1_9RHOB|nr:MULTISPECIES: amino acid synthesis family protein [Pseudooceanicola]MBT9384324.1 amino acid synthesis family protein [Pseudooceanicola endophyticus]MXN19938.1 amino acid synthesis family protein [Pseudooceanicola albus]